MRAIPYLIDAPPRSGTITLCAASVAGLAGAGQDCPEVVPVLEKLVSDPDAIIRRFAAAGLGRMTIEQSSTVKVLVGALRDDQQVRAGAIAALGGIGAASACAVPQILRDLDVQEQLWKERHIDDVYEYYERLRVYQALEKIGPAARDAAPVFAKRINSPDPLVSVYAARVLWRMEPHNQLTIPCFIKTLRSNPAGHWPSEKERERAQYLALRALINIGPEARAALPFLKQFADDENGENHLSAAVAARRLDPGAPTPFGIIEVTYRRGGWCDATTKPLRLVIIEIIADLGSPARLIPLLIESTKDDDKKVRDEAREVLRHIGS